LLFTCWSIQLWMSCALMLSLSDAPRLCGN
jgi:hypothetical protein